MKSEKTVLDVKDREAWRAWLDAHHADEVEIWLVIQKKQSKQPGLSLDDAVEEALCFGWIDSTLNTRDDQSYLLRFSPRKPNSVWSIRNIQRVEKLESQNHLTKSGRAAVQAGKESGEWQAALDRENPEDIPSDLETALRQRPGAMEAYSELPNHLKKRYIYWFQSAKRPETKQKRAAEIVRLVADGG